MEKLGFGKEELYLLWFLNTQKLKGDKGYFTAHAVLLHSNIDFNKEEIDFWVQHLAENKLVEFHNSVLNEIKIAYEGEKFVRENKELFSSFESEQKAQQELLKRLNKDGKLDKLKDTIEECFIRKYLFDEYTADINRPKVELKTLHRDFFPKENRNVVLLWVEKLKKEGLITTSKKSDGNTLIDVTSKFFPFYEENKTYILEKLKDIPSYSPMSKYLNRKDEGNPEPVVPINSESSSRISSGDLPQSQVTDNEKLSPIAKLSDEILLFLLTWREEKDPSLKFWLRNQDNEGRLSKGQWFQGSDYIFVGFTRKGDSKNKTKTIGFVVTFKDDQIHDIYFELSYPDERNPEILDCYQAIALTFHRNLDNKKRHFHHYGIESWQKALTFFLVTDKPRIDFEIEHRGLRNEFEISDEKFKSMLSKILRVRKEQGYEGQTLIMDSDMIEMVDHPMTVGAPVVNLEGDKDKTASFWSDVATDADELGRESLVESVVVSINKLFEFYKDPYTVLLNGEWGSGKSSMLNFFKKHLKGSNWKVIEYNAWENQRFKDPWWILINKISQYASENSLTGEFSSHRFWKFKLQYRHKLWAFLLITVFGVSAYFFSASFGGSKFDVGFYTSLIGLVGTFIGVITGLTNNFFFRSVSQEELKKQFTEHPFEPIRKRFNQIAEDNNLAIFIDDLDRCDVEATVSLLEGIQNLFKDRRVLYIIAADGRWVSNCFSQKYKSFENISNDGCTVGDKFLQKTFQLTLNVPKPDPDTLKSYWDNLIGHVESKKSDPDADAELDQKPTEEAKSQAYRTTIREKKQEKDEKLDKLGAELEENIEKYLRKFLDMEVPDNPRQMKRFVNQYEVARKTLIVEGKEEKYASDEESDKLVKYLIFSMSYPSIADRLKKGEITKEEIVEAKKDSNDDAKSVVNLTPTDRSKIKGLLEGIDEELIKGDFYSL